MQSTPVELLTGHHVQWAVLNVIDEAREFVVLVSPYLKSWPHLEHAIRNARSRGVAVTVLVRSPDGSRKDREKRLAEAAGLEVLGVEVIFVERLHAKAYSNESEVVVTSLNLVSGSHESIELGVRVRDTAFAMDCVRRLLVYGTVVGEAAAKRFAPSCRDVRRQPSDLARGYCIGCAKPVRLDRAKPLCRPCYGRSKRGTDTSRWLVRSCHRCGTESATTLHAPLCQQCARELTAESPTAQRRSG